MRIRDPGRKKFGSRIRDKHPGSVTLPASYVKTTLHFALPSDVLNAHCILEMYPGQWRADRAEFNSHSVYDFQHNARYKDLDPAPRHRNLPAPIRKSVCLYSHFFRRADAAFL